MEPSMWDNLGFVEIIFSGAVALAFGIWQLRSVNKEIAKDKAKAAAKEVAAEQAATQQADTKKAVAADQAQEDQAA